MEDDSMYIPCGDMPEEVTEDNSCFVDTGDLG